MALRYLLLSAALLLGTAARAQTTHVVTVTNFAFTPSTLTIHAGDTVEWHNTQGTHSVHETGASPAGFGNTASGTMWTYEFTFPTSGQFTYNCGVHGASMPGTITVQSTAGTEPDPQAGFSLEAPTPNPFTTSARVRLSVLRAGEVYAAVHDVTGRRVALLYEGPVGASGELAITWTPEGNVPSGTYLLVVRGDGFEATRPLTYAR